MRRSNEYRFSSRHHGMQRDNHRRGSVIDLFCGAGGLSHGFCLEGFRVAKGIDVDEVCRYPFEENNGAHFVRKCVTQVDGKELNNDFVKGEPRILVGCAPCQPFSKYSKSKNDPRWSLLSEFSRIIMEALPDVVSMENVPSLPKFKNGSVFEGFLSTLKDCGYSVDWSIVFCPDFGVPQSRSRLVLLASLHGKPLSLEKTHPKCQFITVRDAIGDLPRINSGEVCSTDPLHRSSKLSDKNLDRIQASIEGGTWHDWPEHLVTDCHSRNTGRSYTSVYGRMKWDEPSPTLTTQFTGFGNGRFGHPDQDRAISLKEGAILQTFPRNYQFAPSGATLTIKSLGRLIGNAVPVKLGRAIAKAIGRHIEENNL